MSTAAATPTSASNALNPPAANSGPKLNMTSSAKGIDAQRKPASPVDAAQRKPPAPKAWSQGTNPITHRPTNSTPTNGAAPAPTPAAKPSASASGETATPMRHLSDRMMYLLANLTGLPGTITLKNGARYSGVLSGTSLDPTELRYVFKMVKLLPPAGTPQPNGQTPDEYAGQGESYVMSFDMSDVADFNVNNVVLNKAQAKAPNGTAGGFRTDTDISGHLAIRERNLQKFDFGEPDTNLELGSGSVSGWDQFATNDRLTGQRSTYDETVYTTAIDRSNPEYAKKAAMADRIAREIESSSATNSHVREERTSYNPLDDQGLDEEDRYSGVRRDFSPLSSGQPNKYTPPARRAPSAQPTVQGAPVDPAILSSTIARPDSAAAKAAQQASAPATTDKSAAALATVPSQPAPTVPSQPATVPSQPEAPKDAAPQTGTKPAAAAITSSTTATAKPAIAAIPPRKAAKPHDATTNVEHDLLDSFKAFSAAEKLRMSERQRSIARENKAVKLNDLKKFALNFKLSTPVPTDLVPILAKDETKQAAIVEKALKQAAETKASPPKTSSPAVSDPKAAAAAAAAAVTRAPAAKVDAASTSPSDRQQSQRPRPGQSAYQSATLRDRSHQAAPAQIPARNQGLLSTRLTLNQQQLKQGGTPYNGVPQPIPSQDMRAPSGPSQSSSGAQTPASNASLRFNVRAHEFKPNPAANTFQPGGNTSATSSPRPGSAASRSESRKPAITSFFGGQRPTLKNVNLKDAFSPFDRLAKSASEADKKHNAGIPFSHRTPPTWDFPEANKDKGYKELFEHAPPPQMMGAHNGMPNGPMPHQHQLPPHLQGQQQQGIQGQPPPQHTPRGPHVQPHHAQGPPHFEAPHMQFSHSTSSVQPSPRQMPPYVYGAQPQQMPSYPQQMQVPQYGMSPGMQHVALRGPQGGQFVNGPGPQMGGHMMQQNPSNGPFMGMPGQPQMHMYAQVPGYQQHPGFIPPGANGFPSPRPGAPMMTHQGSQQGHQQPPMMYMQPGAQGPQMYQMPPGSMTPMRGPYPQPHQPQYGSPHQQHGFPHQAHRGTPSASYAQPMMHQHSQHQHQGPPAAPAAPANHAAENAEEPK